MTKLLGLLKSSGKVAEKVSLERWNWPSNTIREFYEGDMSTWTNLVLEFFPPISDAEGLQLLDQYSRVNQNSGVTAALLIPGITPDMLPAAPPTTPRQPEMAFPPSPPAPVYSPVVSAPLQQPILRRLATGEGDFSPTYGFTAPEQFVSTPPRSPFKRRDSPYPYPIAPGTPSPTAGMFDFSPTSSFSDGLDQLMYGKGILGNDWESLGLTCITGTGALMRGLESPQLASVNAITASPDGLPTAAAGLQTHSHAAAAGIQAAQSPYSSAGSDISTTTLPSVASSTSSGNYADFGYPYNNGVSMARPGKDTCLSNVLNTMVQVHRVASLSLQPLAAREVRQQQQQWIRWLEELHTIVVNTMMPATTHPNTRCHRESVLAMTRSAKALLESLILLPSSGATTAAQVAMSHETLYMLLHNVHTQLLHSPAEMYPVVDTWSPQKQSSSPSAGQQFRLPATQQRQFQQGNSSGHPEGTSLNTWSPAAALTTSGGLRSNYVDALRASNSANWHHYSGTAAGNRTSSKAPVTAKKKRSRVANSKTAGATASKRARRN